MKKLVKSALILMLAVVIAVSSLVIVAAEEVESSEGETTKTVMISGENGTRAYELVWKFKIENSHLYKRRWNATLGDWYDPDWILVY